MGAKPYEEKIDSAHNNNNDDPLLLSGHSLGTGTRVGNTSSSTTTDVENAVRAYTQRFPRGVRRCRKCNDNFKPPRAHHDSVTGRCIVKLDHFCPWVGNAVGIRNHKCFLLFIFYTWLSTLFAGILLIMGFARCGVDDDDSIDSSDSMDAASPDDSFDTNNINGDYDADESSITATTTTTSSIMRSTTSTRILSALYPGCEEESHIFFDGEAIACIVVVLAVFIFTVVMMFDQYEAVSSNMSKIARMKVASNADDADDSSDMSSLERVAIDFNEVFGGSSNSFRLHWLLPSAVDFDFDSTCISGENNNSGDAILGYELDEDAHRRGEAWRWVDPVSLSKRKAAVNKAQLTLLSNASQRSQGNPSQSDDTNTYSAGSANNGVPSISFADIHSQIGTQIMVRQRVNVPSARSRSSIEVPSSRSNPYSTSNEESDISVEFRRDNDDDGIYGFNNDENNVNVNVNPPLPAAAIDTLGNPQDDETTQNNDSSQQLQQDQQQQQRSSLLSDYDKL